MKKIKGKYTTFFGPVVDAIRSMGGSARPNEVKAWILENLSVDPEYLQEQNKSGETKFSNNVDWARYYLAEFGILDRSKRGVWALTSRGKESVIDEVKVAEIVRAVNSERKGKPEDDSELAPDDYTGGAEPQKSESHREFALSCIRQMSPAAFERFCQRLLRESGFEEVHVTGRSGDGGIDGRGILRINPFVSLTVLFQCKRYATSVPVEDVRNFRGAMAGRTDKGIILTTGVFTGPAQAEASREGVAPIKLVNGEELVSMLESLELGLRPITAYQVDGGFFTQFE